MEEDEVMCNACFKRFGNTRALNNHVRLSHTDLYHTGLPMMWTEIIDKKQVSKTDNDSQSPMKSKGGAVSKLENKIMSQIPPDALAQLASGKVKYVMVATDEVGQLLDEKYKHKDQEVGKASKQGNRKSYVKKKKLVSLPMSFKCPEPLPNGKVCNEEFPTCCAFSTHFRDDHKRKKKSNKCQVCEKPLLPDFVDDGMPYKCLGCGQGFLTPKDLRQHKEIIHPKDTPYKCGVCLRRFTQKSNMLQHMRLHTGDKPFTCDYCQNKFRQKSTLTHHLRVHTKDKPYKCIVCLKKFSQYGILRQHMRTHTNIAPFQCHICNHTFKQCHHLSNHLKNFHNIDESKEAVEVIVREIEGTSEVEYPDIKIEDIDDIPDQSIETEVCSDEMLILGQ